MGAAPALVVLGTAFHAPRRGAVEILPDHAIAVSPEGVITHVLPPGQEHRTLVAVAREAGRLEALREGEYLVPGLIDTHVHAPQWPQLGRALDRPLEEWLQAYTFPLEARFADRAFAAAVYDDLVASLLAHGTTTAVYFGSIHVEGTLTLAEACHRRGQRAVIGRVAMDHPGTCPDFYRDPSAEAALAETERFAEALAALDPGGSPRALPAITPRFVPACTDALLSGLGAMAARTGLHVQTHCAEGDWEVAHVRERTGLTDAEALDAHGLLTDRTILAHGTHLTGPELGLLARRGAAVAHCPLSNTWFSGAVFPARAAWTAGVRTGLGTDISGGFSPSSFDAIRHALAASRHACHGTAPGIGGTGEAPLTTAEAFWMATAGGGEALSLPLGLFRPGHAFDALMVRANRPGGAFRDRGAPADAGLLEALVLTAGPADVERVWVGGRAVI